MKRLGVTLTGAVALALAAAAPAAPDTRYLPPPGLYQIDIVSDQAVHNRNGGTMKSHDRYDGKSGGVDTQFQRIDGSRGSYSLKGTGPNRICIEPVKPGGLPKSLVVDGCKATKGVVTNGEMNAVHTCPWGTMNISMRQIDAKTWQTTVQRIKTGSASEDSGDFEDPMQESMEYMLKHGNAEERAEAKRYLAESKKFAEEMKRAPKSDPGPGEGGGSRKEEKSVMRLTRIGDCKG